MSVRFISIKKKDATTENYVAEFLLGAKRVFVDIIGLRETVIKPASRSAIENRARLKELFNNSPDIFVDSELLTVEEQVFFAVQSALGEILAEILEDSKNNNLPYRYTWTAGDLTRTL